MRILSSSLISSLLLTAASPAAVAAQEKLIKVTLRACEGTTSINDKDLMFQNNDRYRIVSVEVLDQRINPVFKTRLVRAKQSLLDSIGNYKAIEDVAGAYNEKQAFFGMQNFLAAYQNEYQKYINNIESILDPSMGLALDEIRTGVTKTLSALVLQHLPFVYKPALNWFELNMTLSSPARLESKKERKSTGRYGLILESYLSFLDEYVKETVLTRRVVPVKEQFSFAEQIFLLDLFKGSATLLKNEANTGSWRGKPNWRNTRTEKIQVSYFKLYGRLRRLIEAGVFSLAEEERELFENAGNWTDEDPTKILDQAKLRLLDWLTELKPDRYTASFMASN